MQYKVGKLSELEEKIMDKYPKLLNLRVKKVNNKKLTKIYIKHPKDNRKTFHIDFSLGFPTINFYHAINWKNYNLPNSIITFQNKIEEMWNQVINLNPNCLLSIRPMQHISRKDHRSVSICGLYKHLLPNIPNSTINSPKFMDYHAYNLNLYIIKDLCLTCKQLGK